VRRRGHEPILHGAWFAGRPSEDEEDVENVAHLGTIERAD
jgi:hypothetical protein